MSSRHSILSATLRPRLVGTLALFAAASSVQAKLSFDVDFSYDANGFFSTSTPNGALARATLIKALDTYSDRFLDTFTAINPSPATGDECEMYFDNPATGDSVTLSNMAVAANVVKVYAGGRALTSPTIGMGNPGRFGAMFNTPSFIEALRGRGQAGTSGDKPTDFGRWGGSIVFDNASTNWNYDYATPNSGSKTDLYSVALHELGHMLGFGVATSFTDTYSTLGPNGFEFTGPKSKALNGGANVPLANVSHYADTLRSTVTGAGTQEPLMAPAIAFGTRKLLTRLDWAGFDDLGYDLARPGDANASGNVNFDDLILLAQNYNKSGPDVSWSEGDFNYSGNVNFDDLIPLAQAYNTSGALAVGGDVAWLGSTFAADWALAQSIVPEPTTFAVLATALPVIGRRRRR